MPRSPGKYKALPKKTKDCLNEQIEQLKASVRFKAEHPFQTVKNLFGMRRSATKD